MSRAREGYKGRLIELPNQIWEQLDQLKADTGTPVARLLEEAAARLLAKPPKKLPPARKPGRKPSATTD